MELVKITVTVNGQRYEREVPPRLLLSDFLREDLELKGTHVGCEHGVWKRVHIVWLTVYPYDRASRVCRSGRWRKNRDC